MEGNATHGQHRRVLQAVQATTALVNQQGQRAKHGTPTLCLHVQVVQSMFQQVKARQQHAALPCTMRPPLVKLRQRGGTG
jgi:hypothetical protein